MEPEYNFATAPISIGHTFGNMTAHITNMVKRMFGPEYFKTINVSTRMAHRYFNILNRSNSGEFIKQSKPILSIRPRAQILTEDTFLANTYLTTRMANNFDGGDFGNLLKFFKDGEHAIESRYLMNRHRMSFDVTILVESYMEQVNIGSYLKNRVRWNMPMNLNLPMECQIPHTIINAISQMADKPLTDVPEFLRYMNAHSAYPITYKMKTSSGNEEFFRYYQALVDAMFLDLSLDDGSKKGMVDDVYAINFTIDVEFEGAGIYHLFSKDVQKLQKIIWNNNDAFVADDGSVIDLLFTQEDIFDTGMGEGWELYSSPIYKVERADKPDTLDLTDVMDQQLLEILNFNKEHNIELDTLINIRTTKDGVDMVEGKDYIIDYKNRRLVTFRVNTMSTYRIIIHVNTAKVNELAVELIEKGKK